MKRLWPLLLIPILVVWLAAPREGPHLILPGVTVASSQGAPVAGGGLLGAPSVLDQPSVGPVPGVTTGPALVQAGGHGGAPHPSSKLGDWSCSDPPLCGETPQPRIVDGPSIAGTASWYRYIPGGAAAGPALRRFLGPHWRGGIVRVCAGGTCIVAQLSDWCQCSTGPEKLIDLDAQLFAALAPLSQGIVNVEVRAIRD